MRPAAGPSDSPCRHRYGVTAAAFSPDGRTVLTGGADKMRGYGTPPAAEPLGRPGAPGPRPGHGLQPRRPDIVTGGKDGTARLWDAASGRPVGHPCCIRARSPRAAFSPDGFAILTAGEETGAALGGRPGSARRRATGPRQVGSCRSPTPRRPTVVTGSKDGTARLWDAATGRPIGRPLRARGQVWSSAFSPDGQLVLTPPAQTGRRGSGTRPPAAHRTAHGASGRSMPGNSAAMAESSSPAPPTGRRGSGTCPPAGPSADR